MFDDWIHPALARQLLLTAGHSLWMGAIGVVLSMFASRLLRTAKASHRYLFQLSLLALLVATPVATYVIIRPTTPVSVHITLPSIPPQDMSAPAEVMDRVVEPPSAIEVRIDDAARTAWTPLVVKTYFIGVVILLMRTGLALRGGVRLCAQADTIRDPGFQSQLASAAARIGIAAPRVRQSIDVLVPTVVGIVRPMVLIPPAALTGLTPMQLEAILAHELAHICRLDPLINLAQRLIEAVLFFNPAVWYVSRRVRIERELCCDEMAVREPQLRGAYAASLLAVAEMALHERQLRMNADALHVTGNGSRLGTRSRLRERIERLLAPPGEFRVARLWMLVAAVVVVMGVSTMSLRWGSRAIAVDVTTQPATQPEGRKVVLTVIEERTKKPVPGAIITQMNGSAVVRESGVTDEQGKAKIRLTDEKPIFAWIKVAADGLASMEIKWSSGELASVTDTLTVEMIPSVTISGRVLDADGNPVAGATVMHFDEFHSRQTEMEKLVRPSLPYKP